MTQEVQEDSREETLVLVVNSAEVIHRNEVPMGAEIKHMTDATYNTFYFLLNQTEVDSEALAQFRTSAAVKLATPPPG